MYNLLIKFSAQYILYIIAIIALIWWLKKPKKEKVNIAIFGSISLLVSFILLFIAGHLYYDPRPFVVLGITPLLPHSADNGFPSDHTILAMTIAFVVTYFDKKFGLILIILATLLGLSRVLAYVHHPLDIIASTGLAALSVLLTAWLIRIPKINKYLNK